MGGEGNIFSVLFSGTQITVGSECPLDVPVIGSFGTLTINGGGTLAIVGSDIDSCSAVYDPPLLPEVSCECTPGCDSNAPFAVGVTCLNFIDLGCVNFFDILTEIDFTSLPPPESI